MKKKNTPTLPPPVPWEKLPKKTREWTSFLNLIIDETMEHMNEVFTPTWIRCFEKKCHGSIKTKMDAHVDTVHWQCNQCPWGGTIRNIFGEESLE